MYGSRTSTLKTPSRHLIPKQAIFLDRRNVHTQHVAWRFCRHLLSIWERSPKNHSCSHISFSWGSLHDLVLVAARSRSKVSHVNIVILLQFLQTRQDPLLDDVLALRRGSRSLSRLLHLGQCLVRRQTTQRIDQNGIGLGDIEANVRNLICNQSIQDGKNGVFNDIECNNRGKSLEQLVCTMHKTRPTKLTEMAKHVVMR